VSHRINWPNRKDFAFTVKVVLEQLLPEKVVMYIKQIRQNRIKARVNSLPILTEKMFKHIFIKELGIKTGDVVFIHNSIDRLNLGFPFYQILTLIQKITGEQGTILFPTYPTKLSSYKYLLNEDIFNVRKTPSYTGILTEIARRQKKAIRSLHPTKSVCALGRYAQELTNAHQYSPFPYDSCSPYNKIMKYNGKIIGLGVSTMNLSFVYCVDDSLKEEFPVNPYRKKLFEVQCVNYDGKVEIVKTYAHNIRKTMMHNIPKFIRKYISDDACKDLEINGMNFFRADARKLFDQMVNLARENITIYPKISYKKGRLL